MPKSSIGNFQQQVGIFSGYWGLISSVIFAIILFGGGIAMIYFGATPHSWFSSGSPCTEDGQCMDDEKCLDFTCQTKPEKSTGLVIGGVIAIIIAPLLVWLAHWWLSYEKKNRAAAQIGGTLFELGVLSDLFGRN